MIFSGFGNAPAHMSFDRMAKAVDEFAKISEEEVLVQTGHTQYRFKYAKTVKFMEHDELLATIEKASLVILQGGWGTIAESVGLGKKVISIPRRVGQECNHPQEEVVRHLEKMGCLIGCYDEKLLPQMVEKARTFEPKQMPKGSAKAVLTEFFDAL